MIHNHRKQLTEVCRQFGVERLEQVLGRPVDLLTERSLRNPLFVRAIAPDRTIVYDT